MKCPLLIAAAITHDARIEDSAVQCGREECAWWLEEAESCAVTCIAGFLATIGIDLGGIRDKMPHAG